MMGNIILVCAIEQKQACWLWGLLDAPDSVGTALTLWWPRWPKLGATWAVKADIHQSIALLKVIPSYSVENLSYITVLEVIFPCGLVMLLLQALVSLLLRKGKKKSPPYSLHSRSWYVLTRPDCKGSVRCVIVWVYVLVPEIWKEVGFGQCDLRALSGK